MALVQRAGSTLTIRVHEPNLYYMIITSLGRGLSFPIATTKLYAIFEHNLYDNSYAGFLC
jgi:hypothetical protein